MIFNTFIDAICALFTYFISLFPLADARIVTILPDSIYNVKLFIADWNWLLPVDTFFLCSNILFSVLIVVGLFHLIRWAMSIITLNLIH